MNSLKQDSDNPEILNQFPDLDYEMIPLAIEHMVFIPRTSQASLFQINDFKKTKLLERAI